MVDSLDYQQRIVDAINNFGETIHLKYRISKYDPQQGEIYQYRRYRNYKAFIRPTDQKDWEKLSSGLKIKDIRKMYFTKPLPKKELIIERVNDGKEYEIVVPPEDNMFDGLNFYYKCFIAVKEDSNDPD